MVKSCGQKYNSKMNLPNYLTRKFNRMVNTYSWLEIQLFMLKKIDDQILQQGIQNLTSDSKAFSYLIEEEDLYTVNDLKERYK